MNFFAQFKSTFAHFSYKLPRWVSFCPDGVSFCPEYHHQPLFFTQQSQTPFGDMHEHKTPPAPPQNTSSPVLILKVGKMNYCLGKMDPISGWAKCLKSEQNFSRSGQKKIIHPEVVVEEALLDGPDRSFASLHHSALSPPTSGLARGRWCREERAAGREAETWPGG